MVTSWRHSKHVRTLSWMDHPTRWTIRALLDDHFDMQHATGTMFEQGIMQHSRRRKIPKFADDLCIIMEMSMWTVDD